MRRLVVWSSLGFTTTVILFTVVYCYSPSNSVPDPISEPNVLWVFEAPVPGGIVAAPWIEDDVIYVSVALSRGLRQSGAVYALDPNTGRVNWIFDHEQRMLPTASAPVRAGHRIFFGEGMHAHFVCNFYCLDPQGQKLWTFETTDHVESTATVMQGTVFFAAGNDGVYALDTETGQKRWQYSADVHIDASPWVSQERVIVGSGRSRRFQSLQVICLDAKSGHPLWRTPTDLPAWGSPRVANGRVFVGLGNGRLNEGAKPPETPAGALLALNESDGRELWRVRTNDAVFQQPTVEGELVYFGSRDGYLRVVHAHNGELKYEVPLGGPVIAPPTIQDGKVFVITVNGKLRCLNQHDGSAVWSYDFQQRTNTEPQMYAAVRVVGDRIFVAGELRTGAGAVASLYCLRLPSTHPR